MPKHPIQQRLPDVDQARLLPSLRARDRRKPLTGRDLIPNRADILIATPIPPQRAA